MADIDDRWQDLGAFIREQRRVGQLSLRRLSEMAGISNPYLSQIERGLRKPSAEILRQIAGALQISAETLYVRAGILDEPDGTHDLEASIRRDPYLDEEHKKTLVHIYRSFRSAYVALHGEPDRSTDDGAAAEAEGTDGRSAPVDDDADRLELVHGNGAVGPRDPEAVEPAVEPDGGDEPADRPGA